MSGDMTRPFPAPYSTYQPAQPRRRRRWPVVLLSAVVAVLLLAVVADRAAAGYAGRRIAQQLRSHGFPGNPRVTVEGFPFLTQLVSRDLTDVHITADGVREGLVTMKVTADATGVRLDPSYRSGTITNVNGTVLVSFSSIDRAAQAAGVPGVRASAAGPHQVKLRVHLAVLTTTAIASVTQAGQQAVRIHVVSAGGLPTALLGSLGDFTLRIPKLPYGLTIRHVGVTSQGVTGRLSGHHVPFGG